MYSKYLIHYNHNHDRLGRFARSAGSAGSKVGSAVLSSGKKKKKQQPPKADIKKGKAANTKLSDKERKRIVESGDAREVAKNKDRLSTRELESAVTRLQREKIQRIDLEKKLSDLNDGGKQRQTAIQKIEKYGNDLERISNGLEKAAKMYNTAAQIHNLFSSGNDQWPLYGKEKKAEKEVSEAQRLRNLTKDKIKDSEVRKAQIKAYREEQMERDQLRDYERERTTKAYQSKQDEKRNKVVSDNEYATKYAESQLARRQAEDNLKDYENSRGESDEERRKRISKIPINIYDSDYYYDEEKKKKLRHSDLVDLGEDYLMHYNHNHDKLGRFARSNGTSGVSSRDLKKIYKDSDRADHNKRRQMKNRDAVSRKAYDNYQSDEKWRELNSKAELAEFEDYENRDRYDDALIKGKDTSKISKEIEKSSDKVAELYDQRNQREREITDRFLGEYADATIKDLKLKNEPAVRDFIIETASEQWADVSKPSNHRKPLSIISEQRQKERISRVSENDNPDKKKTNDFVKDYKNVSFGPNASTGDINAYEKLQSDIISKSVDWYEGKPKSKRTKQVYEKYKNQSHGQSNRKFDDELAGAVLLDLGYKNTPEARRKLRQSGAIIWD